MKGTISEARLVNNTTRMFGNGKRPIASPYMYPYYLLGITSFRIEWLTLRDGSILLLVIKVKAVKRDCGGVAGLLHHSSPVIYSSLVM